MRIAKLEATERLGLYLMWVSILVPLAFVVGGLDRQAHAQTLVLDKLEDGASSPTGWTALNGVTSTLSMPTRTPAGCETCVGINGCSDGIDNDNNGLTDCADPNCFDRAPCITPAPLLSPTNTGWLVAILTLLGLTAIARLRSSRSLRRPGSDDTRRPPQH